MADDTLPGSVETLVGLASVPADYETVLSTTETPDEDGGFGDAFMAALQRENTVISTYQSLSRQYDGVSPEDDLKAVNDPMYLIFNDPELGTEFAQENFDALQSGWYDTATTKGDILRLKQQWDEESALMEDMAKSTPGALVGALAAAVVDPTSYVSLGGGIVLKGARMTKLARAMVAATSSAVTSEAILQATQGRRELSESILNIGTASVIGGGLGLFGAARLRDKPLHPDHPENPLRVTREEQDVVLRDIGDDAEYRVKPDGSLESVSAASSPIKSKLDPDEMTFIPNKAVTALDKIQQFTNMGFIDFRSILSKTLTRASGNAKSMLLQMGGNSGRITVGNAKGKATTATAEDIAMIHRQYADWTFNRLDKRVIELKKELGGLRAKFSSVPAPQLDADVYDLMRRYLRNTVDSDTLPNLEGRYGPEGSAAIQKVAAAMADDVRNTNRYFEAELVKQGHLRDEAKYAKAKNDLDAKRAEITLARKEGADEETLKALRDQRDAIREVYEHQRQKPASLGDEYGMAQVWDRDAIMMEPDAFKQLIREIIANDPDADWLAETYGMTKAQLEEIRGTDKYHDILEEWSGDAYYHRVMRAENAVKHFTELEKQAELDLNDVLRAERLAKRREGQLDLSVARKRRDALGARQKANEAQLQKLRAERRRLTQLAQEVAKGNRRNKRADDRALFDAATAARTEGFERLNRFGNESTRTPRVAKAQERAKASADEARRTRQTERADLLQRNREINAEIARLQKILDRDKRRLMKVDDVLRRVEEKRAMVKQARKDLTTSRKDQDKYLKQIAKDGRAASRDLSKAKKAKPLDKVVDDIFKALSDGDEMPSSIFDERMPTSGRMKSRALIMTPKQRTRAERLGFLEKDARKVLQRQYDDLSGQLALREALSIGDNAIYKSWEERLETIRQDYRDLIAEAKTNKEKVRLKAEMEDVLKDVDIMKQRILRQEDEGDTSGVFPWLSSKFRQMNLARFGAGMGISSLTDAATVTLRHPMAFNMSRLGHVWKSFNDIPDDELLALVHASEVAGHGMFSTSRSTLARLGEQNVFDTKNPFRGNLGKAVGGFDRALEGLAQSSLHLGLLHKITTWGKTYAMIQQMYRIQDLTSRYGSLSDLEVADLASVGIGRAEAALIQKNFKEHATYTSKGWLEPNTDKWDFEALRVLKLAIMRDINRSVVTPGAIDTPRLMSHWAGKLFLQFFSHPYAFMNRFIVPAMQRGAEGDPRVAMAFGMLAFSGTVVTAAKMQLRGENIAENWDKNPADVTAEVIDRAGLLAYLSSPIMAGLKMTGVAESSRYERASAFSNLLGVNAGLTENIIEAGNTTGAFLAGDAGADDLGEKYARLLPYQVLADIYEAFQ